MFVPLRAVEPAQDYRLGAPDVLELDVFELEKPGTITKLELQVPAEGAIMVPYAGPVVAKGKTLPELKQLIERALARVIRNPQITLAVKQYLSREIAVMGAVDKPGVFHLNRNRVTLVEALSLAGGLSKEKAAGPRALVFAPREAAAVGDDSRAAVVMSKPYFEINLVELLLHGDTSRDVWIEPGSVVQVPEAEEFFVQGYVNKAGAFPFRRPTTVLQAISLAGGFDEKRASRSAVRINRPHENGAEIIEVDADAIAAGRAPDVPIYPGDAVDVGRTAAWAAYSEFIDAVKGVIGFGVSAGTL